MICDLLLWTEAGKGNIERAKEALKEIGLVPAKFNYLNPDSETYDGVMVWEDTEGIGRYRVHLYENREIKGKQYDIINFHYWFNQRCLKKEIMEQEPMDSAVQKVLPLIEGSIILPEGHQRILPLQEVLRKYVKRHEK